MKKSFLFILMALACMTTAVTPVSACDCTECLEGKSCPGCTSEVEAEQQ